VFYLCSASRCAAGDLDVEPSRGSALVARTGRSHRHARPKVR
jgi:hypothetical protein